MVAMGSVNTGLGMPQQNDWGMGGGRGGPDGMGGPMGMGGPGGIGGDGTGLPGQPGQAGADAGGRGGRGGGGGPGGGGRWTRRRRRRRIWRRRHMPMAPGGGGAVDAAAPVDAADAATPTPSAMAARTPGLATPATWHSFWTTRRWMPRSFSADRRRIPPRRRTPSPADGHVRRAAEDSAPARAATETTFSINYQFTRNRNGAARPPA